MATSAFTTETFVFQDDSEVVVKPLTIRSLRKFMNVISKLNKDDITEEESLDCLFEACQVAISKTRPDLAPQEGDSATQKKAKRETLEEILDMPTLHKILEQAGGVKLNDPNLRAVV